LITHRHISWFRYFLIWEEDEKVSRTNTPSEHWTSRPSHDTMGQRGLARSIPSVGEKPYVLYTKRENSISLFMSNLLGRSFTSLHLRIERK
jgi:hypothetical protein